MTTALPSLVAVVLGAGGSTSATTAYRIAAASPPSSIASPRKQVFSARRSVLSSPLDATPRKRDCGLKSNSLLTGSLRSRAVSRARCSSISSSRGRCLRILIPLTTLLALGGSFLITESSAEEHGYSSHGGHGDGGNPGRYDSGESVRVIDGGRDRFPTHARTFHQEAPVLDTAREPAENLGARFEERLLYRWPNVHCENDVAVLQSVCQRGFDQRSIP
jgi:hypothetical protein